MVRYTNRIQTDLREILQQALADWFGVGEDKCPVILGAQTPSHTAARCVTFFRLNSHQLGFQGQQLVYPKENQQDGERYGIGEIQHWVDEITFQVNVRAKETAGDDENTPVARDIAEGIAAWLNSWQGISFVNARKMAFLRVSDIRDLVSTDESDLYQITASFDVTLHVGQSRVRMIEHAHPVLEGARGY